MQDVNSYVIWFIQPISHEKNYNYKQTITIEYKYSSTIFDDNYLFHINNKMSYLKYLELDSHY